MADRGAPVVSVVIPTLNRLHLLEATLASVRDQSFTDFEVLVADAGSTEPLAELMSTISRLDGRFRYVSGDGRLTAPQARNLGLAHARAPYIALLDSDDIMVSGRLQRHVDLLDADPTLACVGGWLRLIDSNGLAYKRKTGDELPSRPESVTDAQIKFALPFHMPTLSSALSFRAEALREHGGFDEVSTECDDYSTVWALTRDRSMRMSGEVDALYRHHAAQISVVAAPRQQAQLALLRQEIAEARLGRSVDLQTVVAFTGSRAADLGALDRAETLCDELLEAGLSAISDPVDREWATFEHGRWRARLAKARETWESDGLSR